MKKKIIASLLLSCSICFLGCNNNSSSLSSHSSLSRKEMKEIINNLTLNYQNKDKMRMYTNDLSMEISASYLQTIHTEKYAIKIEDFTSNMEVNNLKLDSMNGIMNIRGKVSSLIDVYNRGIKDEEESNHFELAFNNDEIYLDKDSIYANISKELYQIISNDNTKTDGVKVFFLFDEKNIDDFYNPFNNNVFIQPDAILSTITSQNLLENYLKYSYSNSVYTISIDLKSNDLYTLILDYFDSYATKILIPDDSCLSLSINFNEDKIISLNLDSKIEASVKFDSLGTVDFIYNADGQFFYEDELSFLNSFTKTSDYLEYNENILPVNAFMNSSLKNMKEIYDQITALFLK